MTASLEWTDIGVNFHSSQFKGLAPELLKRARAAGVTRILATGTSLAASRKAIALAQAHRGFVNATAGMHPHSASEFDPRTAEALERLWTDPAVVAVGECGLDYNRMFSPKDAQRRAFDAHLVAALVVHKPLFLHCRDAFNDFHAMLRTAASAQARGVIHCFTDGPAQAEAYLRLGFDIGVTGWVTDAARGKLLREALRLVPLDRIHLETDAPYLKPHKAVTAHRYNEPALLPAVAAAVAEIKGVDLPTLSAQCAENAHRLFGPSVHA